MIPNPAYGRNPQASPEMSIHEYGGLSPSHWQMILGRISRPADEVETKIVSYAQAVLRGDRPSGGYDSRAYFGRRHWERILKLSHPKSLMPAKRGKFLLSKQEIATPDNHLRLYAALEAHALYTLEDYIASDSRMQFRTTHSYAGETLRWNEGENKWQVDINGYDITETVWEVVPGSSAGGNVQWADYEMRTNVIEHVDGSTRDAEVSDMKPALDFFLLSTEDLVDAVQSSPDQMKHILRSKARTVPSEVEKALREMQRSRLWGREWVEFDLPKVRRSNFRKVQKMAEDAAHHHFGVSNHVRVGVWWEWFPFPTKHAYLRVELGRGASLALVEKEIS